jgi:hypothetical protein
MSVHLSAGMRCNLYFEKAVGIFQISWEHGDFHWYQAPAEGRVQAGLKQRFCAWGRRGVACQICAAEARAAHIHQGSRPSWELGEALTSGSQEQVASPFGAPTQQIPKRKPQSRPFVCPHAGLLGVGLWVGGFRSSQPPTRACLEEVRRRRLPSRHLGYTGGTCGACNTGTRK